VRETCGASNLCIPVGLAHDATRTLAQCQSTAGAQGRCVPECTLPQAVASTLPVATCRTIERCLAP
jgi:hypothetical protein